MVTNKPPIDGNVSPRDQGIYDCFIEAANELTNVTFVIGNGGGAFHPNISKKHGLEVNFFTTSMDEYFGFRDANGQLSTHTGIAYARAPYCFYFNFGRSRVGLSINFNIVGKADKFFDKLKVVPQIGQANWDYDVFRGNLGVVKINGKILREAMPENQPKPDITAGIKKALEEIINPTEKVLAELGVVHLTEKKEYK